MANKIDATLLAKAKFDLTKDEEKYEKYFPGLEPSEVTDELLVTAAKLRAEEYDRDVKGYVKELEILVDRLAKHTRKEIVQSNYKRYESYDHAVEAAEAEDPFEAILED